MKEIEASPREHRRGNTDYRPDERAISLLDVVSVLVNRRWLIIGTTFLASLLILLVSILTILLPPDSDWNVLPNLYRPTVKIIIQESKDSLSSKLSSGSAISSLLGGAALNPNIILAQEILKGRTLKDQIIEEFDFIAKYELEKAEFPQTAARKKMSENLGFDFGETAAGPGNVVTISYEDIDPLFGTRVVERVTELLGARFKDLTLEKVRTKKQFVEERLAAVEYEMQAAENQLETFQLRYGVIDISAQAREQSSLLAELRSDVIKAELERQTLLEYLRQDDPKLVRLRQEIEKKNQLIEELKTGLDEYSGELIPQNLIPELTREYLSLQGELSVQEKIYGMLRQEYEVVKLEEADNTQTFQIIEPAEVPEVKAGPFRSQICMAVAALAFLAACVLAFILEYLEKAKRDPVEAEKLAGIRTAIRPRRGRKSGR
jgi:tyrosine-protein kinase Etk/Wzc